MKKQLMTWMGVAALIAAIAMAPRMVNAQQQKLHVVVVHDVIHVMSPHLGGMKGFPPAKGVRRQIPWRRTMPVKSNVQPPVQDPVLQTALGPTGTTGSWINFLGDGVTQPSFSMCCAPPDTNGSAGATQYVQWVNTEFTVFSKATGQTEYGPVEGNTLWQALGGACASNNSGDIIAQYDKQAQRWVMMQPVFTNPYYLCVAVSATSDATGSYYLYQFAIPSNYFPDYPKLAVWTDAYYLSFNDFKGNSFVGGSACALDRSSMLKNSSATMQCFLTNYPSLLASDLDGDTGVPGTTAAPPAGSPDYFMDFTTTNSLNLFSFHVDWSNSANSTFNGPTVLPVAVFTEACSGGTCIPQPGTSQQLDSLGDRLMYRLAYRNFSTLGYESMVVSQSVDTGNGNTGVRWYEIRNPGSNPTVYQQGTFAPDSDYRWMPSIAEDELGDIALGYSVSSSTTYPSIRYTGRTPSDPLGTMETESSLMAGTASQQGQNLNRWGDYSSMSVDPANDCTFWYTNEFLPYNGAFNWDTQIGSFSFPNCAAAPLADFLLTGAPTTQTVTAGSAASYLIGVNPVGGYGGNVTLSVSQPSPLPAGITASFSSGTTSIGASSVNSTLTVSTTASTPSGTYPLTVSGTDGTNTNTVPVTIVVQGTQTPDFSLSSSPTAQTVTQGSPAGYTISVAPSGGFTSAVSLSTSGLPAGTTASYNPASVSTSSGAATSALTVSTSSSTPTGIYPFNVIGTSGGTSHSISLSLTVQPGATSDFTINASPLIAAAAPGSSTSYTVSIAGSGTGSFNGTVNLSVSGVPSRTTTGFSPASITGPGASTLTVSPNRKATRGTYTLMITGTSGSLVHSVAVTFVIGTISSPDFSLSASPSLQSVAPGGGTSYTISISGSNGFTGSVGLAETGLPGGATPTFTPAIVTGGSGSSTLGVATSSSLSPGTYSFTVTGTSGSLVHSASLTLVVQQAGGSGDFSISISPSSQSVGTRSSTSYTVTITALNGFSGMVSLSVNGLPSRTSSTFSPSTITGSGTAALTISTSPKTSTGTYSVTVTGASGSLTHTASATLTIT